MPADYSSITAEAFTEKVNELAASHGMAWLLSLSGVYEIVSEELNNEVLDALVPEPLPPRWTVEPGDGGYLVIGEDTGEDDEFFEDRADAVIHCDEMNETRP